jgi:hypothetical protein
MAFSFWVGIVDEFLDPRLKQLFKPSGQGFFNFLVKPGHPECEIAQVLQIEVSNDLLNFCKSLLKLFSLKRAGLHFFEQLLDQIGLLHHTVDFLLKSDDFDQDLASVLFERLLKSPWSFKTI